MTPGEIAVEAALRTTRALRLAVRRALDRPSSPAALESKVLGALDCDGIDALLRAIRSPGRPRFTAGLAALKSTVGAILRLHPGGQETIEHRASRILDGSVRLFGQEVDARHIDWLKDPISGVGWPLAHYTRTPIRLKEGSDIRAVWELNRLHHLVTLGQAYAFSSDDKYAARFLADLASWCEHNPPRFGPNWAVAMEAGIRAVNVIAAFDLFRDSELIDKNAIHLFAGFLLNHGRFIRSNLEYSPTLASNHFLSDLIGLFAIAVAMPELGEAAAWRSFAVRWLLKEMDRQIYEDGVDYEGSTGYHRFVVEIYLAFFHLSGLHGIALPDRAHEKLRHMFDFVRGYLKPDLTAPQIGDSDDGRLVPFTARPPIDHSYLLSLAAVQFDDWSFLARRAIDEEALWWFGEPAALRFEASNSSIETPGSKSFESAQIYVMRSAPLYSIIDCGDHGAGGRGSHAHSDALSLEVFAYGLTFLRDPGTYAYTSSETWRNAFRSTVYHNTARIDETDISRVAEGRLFALGPNVRCKVNAWKTTSEFDQLDAEHSGYANLPDAPIHRRRVTMDKRRECWLIEDCFEIPRASSDRIHRFELFFNFDAGLQVSLEDGGRAIAKSAAAGIAVVPVSGHSFDSKITDRYVSLSYGSRQPSFGIMYRFDSGLPFSASTLLIPYRAGDEGKVDRILEEHRASQDKKDRAGRQLAK